jgi:hypothetical protein
VQNKVPRKQTIELENFIQCLQSPYLEEYHVSSLNADTFLDAIINKNGIIVFEYICPYGISKKNVGQGLKKNSIDPPIIVR